MENNLTYTQVGDVLLPDLTPPEPAKRSLGKYGLLRRRYLKEHRPVLWEIMKVNGTLFSHLLEVEERANEMLEQMIPSLSAVDAETHERGVYTALHRP